MHRISLCLVSATFAASTASAQSIVGEWRSNDGSFIRLHEDARYEYVSKTESSWPGGCGIRASESATGNWSVQGATLVLDRRDGVVDIVDNCNSSVTQKKRERERLALGIEAGPGGIELVDGRVRYLKQGPGTDSTGNSLVPNPNRSSFVPAAPLDLSGTWIEETGQPLQIQHAGPTLQVRRANGTTFVANGDGTHFKSNDLQTFVSCNIDLVAADRLQFYCSDGRFVATRR